MKDMDDAINFISRDFIKPVSPCRQELRSPKFDESRFIETDSVKHTHSEKTLLNKTLALTKNRNMGI